MNQSSPATALWPHAYRRIQALMEEADMHIGRDRPWDVAIHDDRFYRMWTFYLLSSAGSFRVRSNQLWQVLFSSRGIAGSYEVPR